MRPYAQLIEKIMQEPDREAFHRAIAIDGKGTKKFDDFLSWDFSEFGVVKRTVHIMDIAAFAPYGSRMQEIATMHFFRTDPTVTTRSISYDCSFPRELVSAFQVGDYIPTIAFESRIDRKTGELLSFDTYKATIKFIDAFNMRQVDLMWGDSKAPLRQVIAADPEMSSLLHRPTSNNFAEDLVMRALDLANYRATELLGSKGVTLLKVSKSEGEGAVVKVNEGAYAKFTSPLRMVHSYANFLGLAAVIGGAKCHPLSDKVLEEIACRTTVAYASRYGSLREKRDLYPKIEDGEIERFELAVYKKDFTLAKEMLSKKPNLGPSALTSIANNSNGHFEPCWTNCRIRDVLIARKTGIYVQIVLDLPDGRTVSTSVKHTETHLKFEAVMQAAKEFWKEFFKDPNFEKSFWHKQKPIHKYKIEVEEASKNGGWHQLPRNLLRDRDFLLRQKPDCSKR